MKQIFSAVISVLSAYGALIFITANSSPLVRFLGILCVLIAFVAFLCLLEFIKEGQ